jgi:hypothetical protein
LKLKDIWAIRVRLQIGERTRELALFNLAIDSKLRSCDLVKLRVRDVCRGSLVAAGIASPFMKMFGITLGVALLAKQAGVAAARLASGQGDAQFLKAKIATASFFVAELARHGGLLDVSVER